MKNIMNNKPNVPDEIWFNKKEYSLWKDWKVNGWMFVALIISTASDEFFRDQIKGWHETFRALVAVAPFFAIGFWIRDLARWIRGMDELHRRITLAACFFATGATLFVATACHVLDRTGVWLQLAPPILLNLHNFFDPSKIWVILSLMTVAFFHGYRIFNRRYQ